MNGHSPTLTFTQHAFILQPTFKLKVNISEQRVCDCGKVQRCEDDAKLFHIICLRLFFSTLSEEFVCCPWVSSETIKNWLPCWFSGVTSILFLMFLSSSQLHIQSHQTGSSNVRNCLLLLKLHTHTVKEEGRGASDICQPNLIYLLSCSAYQLRLLHLTKA